MQPDNQKSPNICLTNIAAEIKQEFGKDVHAITVRKALQEATYNCRVARHKWFISIINQKKRLAYVESLRKPNDFWARCCSRMKASLTSFAHR